ncbi:hypothetical protein [Xenorhabdus hominickii]|uniref:DUF930 domain-containing protein n=1 Tax=Xenorhabdus hominickii TaxID=351679 RepID=A0A2G0QF55_XENHO|nr:hypothetical protein [Xenorhabdus hominickii]AOM41866.1 hypothetical protein A9255_15660 [Xenorhabdus hominickii]PHM57838.1 hypothetical protein Xhom_00841 [Xenorhabdus hominickii]
MINSKYLTYFGVSCFLFSASIQAQLSSTPLSKTQKKYLQQQINEQITDKSALPMVDSWSETKKVAEFICRPLALSVIKQQYKDADKVFLGIDSPNDIRLENSSELIGIGMYRTDDGWNNIKFTCKLDANGKAQSFKFEKIVPPKLQTGPGPVVPPKKEK